MISVTPVRNMELKNVCAPLRILAKHIDDDYLQTGEFLIRTESESFKVHVLYLSDSGEGIVAKADKSGHTGGWVNCRSMAEAVEKYATTFHVSGKILDKLAEEAQELGMGY
jgi:hypothetical protein